MTLWLDRDKTTRRMKMSRLKVLVEETEGRFVANARDDVGVLYGTETVGSTLVETLYGCANKAAEQLGLAEEEVELEFEILE